MVDLKGISRSKPHIRSAFCVRLARLEIFVLFLVGMGVQEAAEEPMR